MRTPFGRSLSEVFLMKDEVVLTFAKAFLEDFDIISGKIFYKGRSKELEYPLRYMVETYQLKRKDAEELLDHCMLYNEKGLWNQLDIIKEAVVKQVAPSGELAFPLTTKQLIVLNRMLFHSSDEIMFIATGIGGSGKSTFLNIIKQIFDNDVSSCSLSDLTNEFNVAEAVKHRLIASDELAKGELNLPLLKQLISRQAIHINPKNRTPYEILSQSVLFYCCNKAPRIDVTDTGILRRIIYFEMNTKIKNPNPAMKSKVFTHKELLDIVRAAYQYEKVWESGINWFEYFREETYKYLMKDNSVYICGLEPNYEEYTYICHNKGLKPYSEPVYTEILDLFREWQNSLSNEELKKEVF